jgi:hypothetical protein
MNIQWFSKDNTTSAVTIYENNITISKKAANYFEDAFCVTVGVDTSAKEIIIKCLSSQEAQTINKLSLYNISIKPSYGRINGKQLVDSILSALGFPPLYAKDSLKFNAKWSPEQRMLIINAKKGVDEK